ncbi:lasso peptide biosynthesis B2 protein (plasmid) [Novosphingobium sp. BL-52-GroH]
MARSQISWCTVGSHIVVIDIRRDTYLQLPPNLVEAFHTLRCAGRPAGGPAECLEALARIGLCDKDYTRPAEQPTIRVPAYDMPPPAVGYRRPPPQTMMAALARIITARLAVRALPLRVLAQRVRRLDTWPSRPMAEADVAARTAMFVQARQLLPARGACLPDSIALVHFLRAHEIACNMVFGVRLDPFEAHCWVQSTDAILGDTHERVSCFTPILQL